MDRNALKYENISYYLGYDDLKNDLIFFDKLIIDFNHWSETMFYVNSIGKKFYGESFDILKKRKGADLDYLFKNELVIAIKGRELMIHYFNLLSENNKETILGKGVTDFDEYLKDLSLEYAVNESLLIFHEKLKSPLISTKEILAKLLNNDSNFNFTTTPLLFKNEISLRKQKSENENVMNIIINKFPKIDSKVSWEQIIEFKKDEDSKRKLLALKVWMSDVSSGKLNTREISEKFDHLYYEYKAHLEYHKMKTNMGTLRNISVTTANILGNITSLKWGKAVGQIFDIIQGTNNKYDIESKAPGKEIAYVYDLKDKLKPLI